MVRGGYEWDLDVAIAVLTRITQPEGMQMTTTCLLNSVCIPESYTGTSNFYDAQTTFRDEEDKILVQLARIYVDRGERIACEKVELKM